MSSCLMNTLMAFDAMAAVETASKLPPIIPPATGIIFPRLMTPFSPNFVISLNPIL